MMRAREVLQEPRSEVRDIIAAGYFEQALRLDPTSVPAKAGVASMLLVMNRSIDRAADLITKAEYVAPNSPDVLAAKFRLLIRQHSNQEAVATFSRLLDIDSSAAGIAAEFVPCSACWGPAQAAVPLLERTAQLNPLSADRDVIYSTLGRLLLVLGRDNEAIGWLERGLRAEAAMTPSEIAERQPGDYVIESTKAYLAIAYAFAGRMEEAHAVLASALSSPRSLDFTVRWFLNRIPPHFDAEQQAQERRLAEGLRLAGLRDHFDETADFHIPSTPELRDHGLDSPTPLSVPGGITIVTDELVSLLKVDPKPLLLTKAPANPTIPSAILVNFGNMGSLTDEWQTTLRRLVGEATHGDKQYPIVVFSFSINHWPARNLALRLIALGYTKVYWYRGGWEAWDAHDLPKAPLTVQFLPPAH
jgi:tetratricopeptide (TPR) repeat protein